MNYFNGWLLFVFIISWNREKKNMETIQNNRHNCESNYEMERNLKYLKNHKWEILCYFTDDENDNLCKHKTRRSKLW